MQRVELEDSNLTPDECEALHLFLKKQPEVESVVHRGMAFDSLPDPNIIRKSVPWTTVVTFGGSLAVGVASNLLTDFIKAWRKETPPPDPAVSEEVIIYGSDGHPRVKICRPPVVKH